MKSAAIVLGPIASSLLAACGFWSSSSAQCDDDKDCPIGYTCNSARHLCTKPAPLDAAPADATGEDRSHLDRAASDLPIEDAGSQSDGGPGSDAGLCACNIDTQCYAAYAHNPGNVCQWCLPVNSTRGWTTIVDNYACVETTQFFCQDGTPRVATTCWGCDPPTNQCCGLRNQICCRGSSQCEASLVCQGGACDSMCGEIGDACCITNTCRDPAAVCLDKGGGWRCYECGVDGLPCCAGSTCQSTDLTCMANGCVYCGFEGYPCCQAPTSNYCTVGHCCTAGPNNSVCTEAAC